jgi:hypothetical protein
LIISDEFISFGNNSVIRTETPLTVIMVVICVEDEVEDVDEDGDIEERVENLEFFLKRIYRHLYMYITICYERTLDSSLT